jgi:hypothetical protein
MIGYYVHHVGSGHLHRALAVTEALAEPVTIMSTLPRPASLPECSWVELAADDGPASAEDHRIDVTARERLHWAPVAHDGLRRRAAQLSSWIASARPRLMVVDVSVEVALLCRLHGVPVVCVVLPGRRTDPAHQLGFDIAEALVAAWPPEATPAMLPGLSNDVRNRVIAVGGLTRHATATERPRAPGRRAVLLLGKGGHDIDQAAVEHMLASTPDWRWDLLDGHPDRWLADPAPALRAADVVVTHAGQNAIAEVAAARRPAVVLPQDRPHDEQRTTARVLADGPWPVVVEHAFPAGGWPERLRTAAALDGTTWDGWCDGLAVQRFATLLQQIEPRALPGPTFVAS